MDSPREFTVSTILVGATSGHGPVTRSFPGKIPFGHRSDAILDTVNLSCVGEESFRAAAAPGRTLRTASTEIMRCCSRLRFPVLDNFSRVTSALSRRDRNRSGIRMTNVGYRDGNGSTRVKNRDGKEQANFWLVLVRTLPKGARTTKTRLSSSIVSRFALYLPRKKASIRTM
ncbi:UNVERIFIED_CONTAM: hypothetical protein PYX00_000062 [Menopon gallinae]|uniref:Uncharacterized protein n=1 Tax=Menopon gallinae TaxID=328185 RepID=A0AAW2I7J8_9NEOP